MGEPEYLHIVPLSGIPANKPCCDVTGERNYRRGYHQGYKYALSFLAAYLPERFHEELRRWVARELHTWSVRAQLPKASRFEVPPKPKIPSGKRVRRPAQPGVVYVVLAEGTTRVKIGWSATPQERIDALRTACPFPIRLLREIGADSAQALERHLHKRYATYRQHGEWFELPDALLGALMTEDFRI